jgi:hypothetical protein
MKRLTMVVGAMVAVVGLFAGQALAANAHLRNNVRPNPQFEDKGLTLLATAYYTGLGNFNTEQRLAASADPTADCVNPGTGEHRPPGHNPASVTVTGSTAVPKSDIKNGNVTIATQTNPPVTPISPDSPDFSCPNRNWTENITDMAFTSATLRVFQDSNEDNVFQDSELVLTVSCTFNPATSNGVVPGSSYFPCTES